MGATSVHINWKKFEQAVLFAAPLILPAVGVPAEAVNLVVHGVLVAEHAANGDPKTGAQKKAIALDAIETGLKVVNEAKPGTVDVAQVLDAASDGIDATIKAVNAAHNIPVRP